MEEMELDPLFVERDKIRKAGGQVVIAVTDRLVIRESKMEDVPELFRLYKEEGMEQFVKPMQSTLEEELEFMQAYIRHAYLFFDFGLWTILEKETGRIVGRAGLFSSEILDEGVELGYLIGKEFQGRGYASECGSAILKYADEILNLEEVHLIADFGNEASCAVAEKLGFVFMERLGNVNHYYKKVNNVIKKAEIS